MGVLRAMRRILDAIDAFFALVAFVVIVLLLASGKVPHDLELWVYGVGGFLLLLGIAAAIWGYGDRQRRSR
jgi:hypothetical protein